MVCIYFPVLLVHCSLLFQILSPQLVCKILGARNQQVCIYENMVIDLTVLPKRKKRKLVVKFVLFSSVLSTLQNIQ